MTFGRATLTGLEACKPFETPLGGPYTAAMTMRLTRDQEAIVHQAVADGLATSAEDFVSLTLARFRDHLSFGLEERLGMSIGDLNREIARGLHGPGAPWEGADAFNARMRSRHRQRLHGYHQE